MDKLGKLSSEPVPQPIKRAGKPGSVLGFHGGETGIRTPDTLLAHTRFPIVLLRPARTSLRFAIALHLQTKQQLSSIQQPQSAHKRRNVARKNSKRSRMKKGRCETAGKGLWQAEPAFASGANTGRPAAMWAPSRRHARSPLKIRRITKLLRAYCPRKAYTKHVLRFCDALDDGCTRTRPLRMKWQEEQTRIKPGLTALSKPPPRKCPKFPTLWKRC